MAKLRVMFGAFQGDDWRPVQIGGVGMHQTDMPDDPEARAAHWMNVAWQDGDRVKVVDDGGRVISMGTVRRAERGEGLVEINVQLDRPDRVAALAHAYGGELPPLQIEPE